MACLIDISRNSMYMYIVSMHTFPLSLTGEQEAEGGVGAV